MTQSVILSSNQIHRLHHTFFIPKGDIRATLLIVHGMSEHGGRYDEFAKFLADHGILVATYDQLGHGKTVKDKYELGFFDEKHPVQVLCKDVIIMADKLKQKANALNAQVPHFIMGHSMGSFVVRTVLTHHATNFDGCILMGTGNSFGLFGSVSLATLSLLNFIKPKRPNTHIAYLLNQYLLKQLRTPIHRSMFAWLAENQDAIDAFEADELCGFAFSNNGFLTLQALIKKACNPNWYAFMHADYPILLISGKDDPVGRMGQDVMDLHDELLWSGKRAISNKLYPNMRHEVLHETDKQQAYDDILAWLNGQL